MNVEVFIKADIVVVVVVVIVIVIVAIIVVIVVIIIVVIVIFVYIPYERLPYLAVRVLILSTPDPSLSAEYMY
jgi:hypothetical protein